MPVSFFLSSESDLYAPQGPLQRVEKRLNHALGRKNYGPALKDIGIIPIILSDHFGRGVPERRLYQRKSRGADYRTRIDHIAWVNGGTKLRELLLVSNVIAAISDLGRKIGPTFRADDMINDICKLYRISAQGYGTSARSPNKAMERTVNDKVPTERASRAASNTLGHLRAAAHRPR